MDLNTEIKNLKEAFDELFEYKKSDRTIAAINSIPGRYKALIQTQTAEKGTPEDEEKVLRRLHQAQNIAATNGEGGFVTRSTSVKNQGGVPVTTRSIESSPATREFVKSHPDSYEGNTVSWDEHEKAKKEAIAKKKGVVAPKKGSLQEQILELKEAFDSLFEENKDPAKDAKTRFNKEVYTAQLVKDKYGVNSPEYNNCMQRVGMAHKTWKELSKKGSLQEQILELKEAFDNLFEEKGLKLVHGTPEYNAVFKDEPELHRVVDLEKTRKNAEAMRKYSDYDAENGWYNNRTEPEKEPIDNDKPKRKSKMNDNNSLQEQILELKEAFDNLFEAGVETESTGNEKEVSPNKISKSKKDKDGNKTEVVSVADELFPYEGNAKQQYNQKIIAKINDMIEGTATLEDLIHLVRQKKVAPTK